MAKLGFLGLGLMGYPMARNLLKAGHEVAVWSKTRAKVDRLAAEDKAVACASPKEVAEHSEGIFLCVGDSAMSRETILGSQGVLAGARPGAMIADASTISPAVSREIGAAVEKKGVRFLDAPCTGSTPGATNGTLTFMIGGDRQVFERAKPWFEAMGKLFYFCGGPGMGLQAKLTQNAILANLMQAFNEGMVLCTKGGVDPALMLEILNNSAAKSGLIASKAPAVFRRDFTTAFSTKWMHKDVSMALDSGKELGVPMPLTAVTQQMFQAAMSMGYAEDDMASTIKVEETWAGVEVRPATAESKSA